MRRWLTSWRAVAILAAVAVVAVVAAVLVSHSPSSASTSSGIPASESPPGLKGIIQSPLLAKPDFTLTDTAGQPFSLRSGTAGYVTLLYFGYTHCPDVCPTQMADMAIGLSKVSASVRSHVKVVFVTTDPQRDTPSVIRDWLNAFNRSFVGLTGTTQQIDAAEAAIGMPPTSVEPIAGSKGDYAVDHLAYVLAFTTDNQAHVLYPSGITASVWTHDLPRLVKEWT
ncbi:MAG: SCO family protein [Acidimicrobiales bacterium]